MADIVQIGERRFVEDGQGGWREATASDYLKARIELPPGMLDKVNERLQEDDINLQARMGKLPPGSAPQVPLNEPGTTQYERFKVMNAANNPDEAIKLIRAMGYKVKQHGGGWNFATSKNGESWKLVDPTGFDFPGDLFDLTFEAVGAFMTSVGATLGAAGGAMGAVALGAAGSTIAEGARQGMAGMMGVDQPAAPENLMTAAVAGGAVPAIEAAGRPLISMLGRGLNVSGRALKEAALESGAGLTRTGGAPMFPAEDVFSARIRSPIPAGQSMREADAIYNGVRDRLKTVFGYGKGAPGVFPEEHLAREVEGKTAATVSMNKALRPLMEHANPQSFAETVPTISDPTLANTAQTILDRIHAALEAGGISPDAVPASQARTILRELQKINSKEGLYKGLPVTKNLTELRGGVTQSLRLQLGSAVDTAGPKASNGMDYTDLMAKLDKRMRQRAYWTKAGALNKPDEEGRDTFSRWAASLWGRGRAGRRLMVKNIEDEFGIDVMPELKEAFVSANFGEAGRAPMKPPTGGVGMFGRMTSSLASMTPISPRFVTGTGRFMSAAPGTLPARMGAAAAPLMNMASKAGPAASTSTRQAMMLAAQELSRRYNGPEVP